MKKIVKYINTLYRPSYILLTAGLFLFSVGLIMLSLEIRRDIILENHILESEYIDKLSELLFPILILLPVSVAVDLRERNKKKK